MLAAAYFASAVSAVSALRMRTAAIPHDVAVAVGDEGAVLRETCPERAFHWPFLWLGVQTAAQRIRTAKQSSNLGVNDKKPFALWQRRALNGVK